MAAEHMRADRESLALWQLLDRAAEPRARELAFSTCISAVGLTAKLRWQS